MLVTATLAMAESAIAAEPAASKPAPYPTPNPPTPNPPALTRGSLPKSAVKLPPKVWTPAEPPPSSPDTQRLIVGAYPGARADLADTKKTSANIVADPDWYIWGGSVIAENGKYHMFAERWPRKFGFNCWLTHAEIAHYVADKPEGPFRFAKTVLTGRGRGHWDQIAAYNPYLCKFNGRFYLYYVSTNHPTMDAAGLVETARAGGKSPNWLPVRDAQRVGLAVADSLDGPWQRSEKPVVEPHGSIVRVTVNPAVCLGPDGRYHMIVKGDKPIVTKDWTVIQATAVADKPEGPWQIQSTPAFGEYNTEDACIWYDLVLRRFYAVVHVHHQSVMAMITSTDGIHWEKAARFKLMPKEIPLAGGGSFKAPRMERPFVLIDAQGRPSHIYLAIFNGSDAYNVVLKLDRDVSPGH